VLKKSGRGVWVAHDPTKLSLYACVIFTRTGLLFLKAIEFVVSLRRETNQLGPCFLDPAHDLRLAFVFLCVEIMFNTQREKEEERGEERGKFRRNDL